MEQCLTWVANTMPPWGQGVLSPLFMLYVVVVEVGVVGQSCSLCSGLAQVQGRGDVDEEC